MTDQKITKYVGDWFARADEDLAVAKLILDEDRSYNPACFHVQQAAEKYLKGFLAHHEKHARKIHDLGALLHECIKIDQSFDGLQDSARYLSRFYVESRYPDDYVEFTREDAEKGLEAALRIKDFVLEKIKSGKNEGFGIIGIIIILAVVAVLGGSGLFVYQYFSVGFACTQEAIRCSDGSIVGRTGLFCRVQCPRKSEEPTSEVQEIDTSTWKTYRNEKYGFEVRYPSDLKVGEGRLNIYKEFSINKGSVGFSTNFDSDSNTEFEIYIFSDNKVNEFNRTSKGPLFLNRKRLESTQEPMVISVGGVPATEVNVSRSALEIKKPYIKNVYFTERGIIYVFATRVGWQDWTVEKSQKQIDRFYQILATFRFTEPILETGPGTYCDSDKDCWCQEFTGAGFGSGKVEWTCDTSTNHCEPCLYY